MTSTPKRNPTCFILLLPIFFGSCSKQSAEADVEDRDAHVGDTKEIEDVLSHEVLADVLSDPMIDDGTDVYLDLDGLDRVFSDEIPADVPEDLFFDEGAITDVYIDADSCGEDCGIVEKGEFPADVAEDLFFDEGTNTEVYIDTDSCGEECGIVEEMVVERKTLDVRRFGVVEYAVYLPAEFDNPFDPEEVEVKAVVRGPLGVWEVFGFYFQDYDFVLHGGQEGAVMVGEPHFRVRVMPLVEGMHRVSFEARVGDKRLVGREDEFWAGPPANKGVIKVRSDKRYLVDAFGNNFVPVGPNIAWAGAKGVFDYEKWFSKLQANGGNYARIWMAPFTGTGIEWLEGQGKGDFHGLGRYALQNARRLDRILDLAQEAGVYVMLVLGFHGELTEGGYFNEGMWRYSPYNSANGGPCADADCFFQNEEAKRYYKRKLRYIASRWGAYANIMAFELWNEVTQPKDWVDEMAGYLKSLDPYGHMVSTTWFHRNLAQCPALDFAQNHVYGYLDLIKDEAEHVIWEVQAMLEHFDLPVFVGEAGIDWSRSDAEWDPNGLGIALHNEMFSAFSAGAMGPASSWWWDSYIDRFDLWRVYKPFVTIVEKFSLPLRSQPIPEDMVTVRCEEDPLWPAPRIRWLAVGTGQEMFVWVQNRDSTWYNGYLGNWPPVATLECTLTITHLPPGQYQVQWFETWNNGELLTSLVLAVTEDRLFAPIPPFDTDVAGIIRATP